MSWKSKGYVTLVALGGLTSIVELTGYWKCDNPLRFAVFVVLSVLTSFWKISLPGVRGTMSVNFLLVLVGCTQLSPGETLAMALLSVLAQYFYRIKAKGKDRLIQAAFNIGSVAIAVRMTTLVYFSILPLFPSLDVPFRLAITAFVYFIMNTFPVSIVISLTEDKPLMATWKACFFWSFPYYMIGAAISGLLWEVKSSSGWQLAIIVGPITYVIYRSYELYLGRLQSEKAQVEVEKRHSDEVASLHLRTIEVLALAIEAKDQTTHDHVQRVQIYCTELGKLVGLDDQLAKALEAASLLHDIGKLAVPEHIISKPGKLTREEFEKMKIHPVVGAEILARVRFPYPVVPIVRHHHEKWDGSGYPDGLIGAQIPLGARILSAVDCFDALTSDRPYRPALPKQEALAYLSKEAGRTFDPQIVEMIATHYLEWEELVQQGSAEERVRLSTDIKIERGVGPAAGFDLGGAAHAGDRAEFVDSIAAAHAEAQFLMTMSQDMIASGNANAVLEKTAEALAKLVPYQTMAFYQLEGETLYPYFVAGNEKAVFGALRIPKGQGLSGWVVAEQKTILNGNPAVDPGCVGSASLLTNHRSAISVPVSGAEGVSGALTLYSAQPDQYTRDHLRILMFVASRLADFVENRIRFEKASGDAFTDELTGLPNSRCLMSKLGEACEAVATSRGVLAVAMIDLDGFKAVNDEFGHLAGNQALREIAGRSRAILPEGAILARVGGDEFVALLPDMTQAEVAALAEQMQRITERVGSEITSDGRLSCSWGMAMYGEDGADPQALLAVADRRMYEQKRLRKMGTAGRLVVLAGALNAYESGHAKSPEVAGARG